MLNRRNLKFLFTLLILLWANIAAAAPTFSRINVNYTGRTMSQRSINALLKRTLEPLGLKGHVGKHLKATKTLSIEITGQKVGRRVRGVNVASNPAIDELARALQRDARVASVEKDTGFNAVEPGARKSGNTPVGWGVGRVKADAVHRKGITGKGTVVAIIDSGFNDNVHIKGNLAKKHYDATNEFKGKNAIDNRNNWHGTHVADTVRQIAPDAQLMSVKVLKSNKRGSWADVSEGIIWAADNGADIINLSLGARSGPDSVRRAVAYAEEKGVRVFASAGNDNSSVGSPGVHTAAISAISRQGKKASFSNSGPEVWAGLPGVGIRAAAGAGNGTRLANGTSMASPHAAGLAALVKQAKRSATPKQMLKILARDAEDLGLSRNVQGIGMPMATAALRVKPPKEPPVDPVGPIKIPRNQLTKKTYTNPKTAALRGAAYVMSRNTPLRKKHGRFNAHRVETVRRERLSKTVELWTIGTRKETDGGGPIAAVRLLVVKEGKKWRAGTGRDLARLWVTPTRIDAKRLTKATYGSAEDAAISGAAYLLSRNNKLRKAHGVFRSGRVMPTGKPIDLGNGMSMWTTATKDKAANGKPLAEIDIIVVKGKSKGETVWRAGKSGQLVDIRYNISL